TLSASARTSEIPLTIEGDPTNSNPRANCILQTRTVGGQTNNAVQRLRLRNLTLEQGEASLMACNNKWLDNVEIRAKSGFILVNNAPIGGNVLNIASANWWVTRSKIWRSSWSLAYLSAGPAPGLLRANELARRTAGIVFVKNRTIGSAEDGTTAATDVKFEMHSSSALYRNKEDVVVAYNDMRYLQSEFLIRSFVTAALAGTLRDSHRRHLIMNNVIEYIGSDQGALIGYGESELVTVTQVIVEGNTLAGAGMNLFYNNPNAGSLANASTLFNEVFDCIVRNNAVDRNASKHDDFNDPEIVGYRPSTYPYGYRPHLVQGWANHNGCNIEAHVDHSRSGNAGSFRRDGVGPRSIQYAASTNPNWTNDLSYNGGTPSPSNPGGGDYTPTATSAALNRILRANSDRDLVGNARRPNGASGALEATSAFLIGQGARHVHRAAVTSTGITLAALPAGGRHVQRAAASQTGLALPTAPLGALHGHRAAASAAGIVLSASPAGARHLQTSSLSRTGWSSVLASAATRLVGRASPALLAWAGVVAPNKAVFWLASQSPALDATDSSLLLAPGQSRLALIGAAARLLPNMAAGVDQTMLVRSDARTIFITQTEQEL
ncbi:MAG: hypothetical protein H7268_03990, partial [Sandarakinorhabdus sp.]|nr:hypothetical protein [Sandarakinorhabdus sp.]